MPSISRWWQKPHPKHCSLPSLFSTADRDQPVTEKTSVPKDWGYAGPDQPHSMDETFSSSSFSQEPGRGQAARPFTNPSHPPSSSSSFYQLRIQSMGSSAVGPFSFMHLLPLPRQPTPRWAAGICTCRQARTPPASQPDFSSLASFKHWQGALDNLHQQLAQIYIKWRDQEAHLV